MIGVGFAHLPITDLNDTAVANEIHCIDALQATSETGRAVTWFPACRKMEDFAPQQVMIWLRPERLEQKPWEIGNDDIPNTLQRLGSLVFM